MEFRSFRKAICVAFCAAVCCVAAAQSRVRVGEIPTAAPIPVTETILPSVISDQFRAEGDSLMMRYDFNGAITCYINAMRNTTDTLREAEIERRMALCEFSYEMTGMCERPTVVGKQKFSRDDFYLYYPLPDRAWHINSSRPGQPIYAPEGAEDIYFSSGKRFFPMVCGDKLYFSSERGGMGGYDLYVAQWNSSDSSWGEPKNLGFPYNSPYNDFLYVNTSDGKYTLFASDRECPGTDSVYVYVLEQNMRPGKVLIESVGELADLCRLDPSEDIKPVDNSDALSSMSRDVTLGNDYSRKIAEVGALRDSLSRRMAGASEEELASLREKLDQANAELQKIEADFLFSGSQTDFHKIDEETDKEVVVGIGRTFIFTKKRHGIPMNFRSID